jgi:hypothetical protein
MKFLICILALSLSVKMTYADEAETYKLVLPKGTIKLSPGPEVKSLGVPSTNEHVRAGQVAMSAKDCKELAVNVSTVAFSPDKSSNYSLMNLKKDNSFNYFDTTRKEIKKELYAYCENDKSLKTVQDFQEQFHSACGSTCSNNLDKFYKKPTFGSNKEKDNADLTCLSICNRTNDNLDFLRHGARLSEKQRKPETSAAADCNGVVSNKGRNMDVKTFITDDIKNQRIRDITDAER